jgi:hypothetical protein
MLARMPTGYRRLHSEWGISAPGANTDAIDDVTVPGPGYLRVWVSVATATIVNVMLNPAGAVGEQTVPLKDNLALDGGGVFDVPCEAGDVVNIQVETDSALHYVVIDYVKHGIT